MPFNNKTKDILKIAENVLGAQIAVARRDNASAIGMLREAVTVQDSLKYGEPPDWFFPVRESLGAVLLMNGDAKGADRFSATIWPKIAIRGRSLVFTRH
jgi:hypothetical protein